KTPPRRPHRDRLSIQPPLERPFERGLTPTPRVSLDITPDYRKWQVPIDERESTCSCRTDQSARLDPNGDHLATTDPHPCSRIVFFAPCTLGIAFARVA